MLLKLPTELLLVSFATCILVTALADREMNPRLASLMQTLGDASFGLYMLHLLVGFVVFSRLEPRLSLSPMLWAAIATVISVGAAILSYRYFESPARRMITRLGVRRLNPQQAA